MTTPKKPKRSYRSLLLLFLAFALPFVAAYYLYLHPDVIKHRTVNKGHLIKQPLDFYQLPLQMLGTAKLDQLRGRWLMVYVSPGACGKWCEKNLYYMRQIKTATWRDSGRVERVILTFTGQKDPQLDQYLTSDYKGTFHLEVTKAAFSQFIVTLSSRKLALRQGTLYLVDPKGNIMMSYPPDTNPSDVLKDLTKLLKYSQIG